MASTSQEVSKQKNSMCHMSRSLLLLSSVCLSLSVVCVCRLSRLSWSCVDDDHGRRCRLVSVVFKKYLTLEFSVECLMNFRPPLGVTGHLCFVAIMPGYWQPIAARLPSFIDFEPIYGLNSSVSQNGKNCQKCHPSEAQATPPAGGGGSSNSLQQQTNHGWRLDSIV